MKARTKVKIGDTFGRLTCISKCDQDRFGNYVWLWSCTCGRTTEGSSHSVSSGHKKSCGCINAERMRANPAKTHGLSNSAEYRIWATMKSRCHNQKSISFKDYGGRGIKVQEPFFSSFQAFYDDIGPRPSKKHSVERINNDGHYEAGNVRWATRKEQEKNKRPQLTPARLLKFIAAADRALSGGQIAFARSILRSAPKFARRA